MNNPLKMRLLKPQNAFSKRTFTDGAIASFKYTALATSIALVVSGHAYADLEDGLVACYSLNGNAQDRSGNANHGEVHEATLTTDRAGNPNSAYSFNGTTSYIEIQDSDSLDEVNNLTMAAWVYRTGNCPSENDACMIFNKEHSHEWAIKSGNTLQYAIKIQGSWAWRNTGVVIPQNQWVHVAFTFDGTTLKVYKDKVEQQGVPQPSNSGPVDPSNELARIGGRTRGSGSSFQDHSTFNGKIDEVRLYKRALTADEIGVLFDEQPVCNRAPTNITLSSATVAENQASGTTVGTFTTTDANTGDSHTYSLVAGTDDTDNSSFTIDSSMLKTAAAFDYETKNNYSIRVQTDDGNGGTFAKAVTITVTDVNEAPTLSDISDQTTDEDTATGAISFTVADPETAADSLNLSATSSNPTLVPNDNISLGGSGTNRTVTVTPAANQSGTATITVTVSDGSLNSSDTFDLTVNPVNDAPTVSDISDQTTDEDTATGALSFTVADPETAADSLNLSATSSNPTLVPNDNISLGGSGTARTVTVTPAANQSGTATITVTVSDGSLASSDTFDLTVNPVNDAPTVSNVSLAGFGNATLTLAPSDFENSFSDQEGDSLAKIKLTQLPNNGTLKLNGTDVSVNDEINASELGKLTYTIQSGSCIDSFDWTASDGTDYATSGAQMNLTVNPINVIVTQSNGGIAMRGNGPTYNGITLNSTQSAKMTVTLSPESPCTVNAAPLTFQLGIKIPSK
jgi:hypothetical protein